MKETLRHYLNPLHVFCRLKNCGLRRETAMKLCEMYQRFYSRIL